jgi:hypothetical protein
MKALRPLLGLAVSAWLASGCVGGKLDRPFAAGQYLEVARLFEADSALHDREDALYMAALAYGLPASPAYAPDRAVETLDRLLMLYPRTGRRTHALHLREILREARRLALDGETREQELAEATAALAAERERVGELEDRLAGEEARGDGLQAIADRLTREVQQRNARIQALEEELAALKEIDLNRPPPEPAIVPDSAGSYRP